MTRAVATMVEEPVDADRRNFARSRALAALCIGYFMVILDTTVVNVALPDIQRQLGASFASLQWVVDGYALIFASLLLTGGGLADRLGGRRTYLAGFSVFISASVLCGAAPTMGVLLAARAVQGAGAALLVPASLRLLRATFATASSRASAVGIWAATAGLAAGSGPVVGGVLVGMFGWRSAFVVNLPVGLFGLLLTARFATATPGKVHGRFDVSGTVASVMVLGGLTTAIIEGAGDWLNVMVVTALLVAAIGSILLIVAESKSTRPLLPLALFKNRVFSAVTAIGLMLNFGFYGQLFLLSLFFQESRGLSPVATGLALLPETGIALFANIVAGRITARIGPRWPMIAGLLLSGTGLLLLVPATSGSGYIPMVSALIAVGFGAALTVPAITVAILEVSPEHQAGMSAAVLNAGRQMGGVLGVAVLGSLAKGSGATLPGLNVSMIVAGGVMLLGCSIGLFAVRA